ncbi:hypothetical protein AC578_6819 [Pseudocercospora eumusae]|uniref:Uncharacterized protein n=1 Tax=Pseudocercospora eumusae TaxID=321146 RepID=A0A139H4W9_9PEZI|nr:hypothetical protein AC578_6819 [Pseudocercospora eumusae]
MEADEAGLVAKCVEREVVDGATHTYCRKVLRQPVQHADFSIMHSERFQHEIQKPGGLVEGSTVDVQTAEQQVAVRHEGMVVYIEWQTRYMQSSNKDFAHGGAPPVDYSWPNRLCIDFSGVLKGSGGPGVTVPPPQPTITTTPTFASASGPASARVYPAGPYPPAPAPGPAPSPSLPAPARLPNAFAPALHHQAHPSNHRQTTPHFRRRSTDHGSDLDDQSENDDVATVRSSPAPPKVAKPNKKELKRMKNQYNAYKALLATTEAAES